MAKSKFPKQVYVAIENEGDSEQYLNVQKDVEDFSFYDEQKRTLAIYELKEVITAERMIAIK